MNAYKDKDTRQTVKTHILRVLAVFVDIEFEQFHGLFGDKDFFMQLSWDMLVK